MAEMRSFISRAALLVKVTARIGPCLAGGDEVGKAGRQRGGLAGARPGQHQHRTFGGQHRLALRRVEAGEIGRLGGQGRGFGHRFQLGRRERNGNLRGPCAGLCFGYLAQRIATMGGVPASESRLTPDIPVIHRLGRAFFPLRDSDSLCRFNS
jgi:hypothetical protein